MSKIICDVCGTSYPETAVQCPICGCVRPGEVKVVAGDTAIPVEEKTATPYTHVKGGRFSKANVRKRNMDKGVDVEQEVRSDANENTNENDQPQNSGKNKVDVALTVTVIALLLAIVAVVVYIVLRFFTPAFAGNGSGAETKAPTVPTTASVTTIEETDAPTVATTEAEETTVEPTETTEETTIPEETTEPEQTYPDKTYKVDIGYSYNPEVGADITVKVGDEFTLKLVDDDGNVYDVEWLDEEGSCEIDGNSFKAIKDKNTVIYTVVNDEKYTCIVRIY